MSKDTTSENLRAELKSLADTLEEVLNSSADKSKEEVSKLRSKAEQALKAAARADEYVRDNPWTGVGIGAAVGVVLGVLLTRR